MYAVDATTTDGHATTTLVSRDHAVEATFAPSVGMIGCSLRHRGVELLAQRGGLAQYAASGSTMGIPLLHPWANRLGGFVYTAGGRRVQIEAGNPRLHRDGHGLPMHGLLGAHPGWRVLVASADAGAARLSAVLDFGADPLLLAAFPYPHALRIDVTLRDATLTIATTLRPSADVAVPVSLGYHPYLQLPGVARADWHVEAPVRRRLLLDDHMLPDGESDPVAFEPGPLGRRDFDDLFTDLERPARFVLAGGGRRLTVEFDAGYAYAQIYAPPGDALICFEPMTAPTNALLTGTDLPLALPGTAYRAGFSISVDAPHPRR